MVDHYLWGKCERISPEAPVQVIEVVREEERLGGACNVMQNLSSLGAEVYAAGIVGADANSHVVIQRLEALGIHTAGIVAESGRKTTKKSRIIAGAQQVVRVDRENRIPIHPESAAELMRYIGSILDKLDAILMSDYAKGVLESDFCRGVIVQAKNHGVPVLVDPKGSDYTKYAWASLITPNKKEAAIASHIDIVDDASLKRAGFWLKESCELDAAMITLSEEGMAIFEQHMVKIPTIAREVYDVTGAGDTVLAALGFYLTCEWDLKNAARFANAAAAVVVGKVGSATATLGEIEAYERRLRQEGSLSKIRSCEEIGRVCDELRKRNKKIVFTNGCFDLLHAGHVSYLEAANQCGDVLVLGLNSDESVRRLKGPSRPVNNQADRARVLAALESVDFVVLFGEDTPYELIQIIQPDVLVKGGDYEGKEVVGSDIAREVRLIPFVEGKSTTGMIDVIQQGVSG